MKAVVYEAFGELPQIQHVADPTPTRHGVVIRVEASGVCRSDFHGWGGHDPSIEVPNVPGHEFAGVVEAVGADVTKWKAGDRVTVPFVGGCGSCPQCYSGNQQVCDDQFQPGFTHWGSFAQFVAIDNADLNVVGLPDDMAFATAASLGCRFITSFRGVVDQGRVGPGQWVAVHGHPLSWADSALVDHAPKARDEPATEAGGGGERHVIGEPHHVEVCIVDRHELSERTPVGEARLKLVVAHLLVAAVTLRARAAPANERDGYPIAGLPLRHVRTNGFDDSGKLVPGNVRNFDGRVVSSPPMEVATTDS